MARPLYRSAAYEPRTRDGESNAGLWYDKFCDQWQESNGAWSLPASDRGSAKLTWITTLTGPPGVGTPNQVDECAMRMVRLAESRAGRAAVFVTESRFVTGLGRSHPVENGFAWHPTLGAPYLPGSSTKGLVRGWAREHADAAVVARLFGDGKAAGAISFLDAVPIAPVVLEADVMTPHYAGWTEADPPGDWRSPTPIPFLVTSARSKFVFCVLPCASARADDVETAFEWLESALAWAGAGAKTAVGYGRMQPDETATAKLTTRVRRQREELVAQTTLSPLDLELRALSQADSGKAAYLAWLNAVEKRAWAEQPETERRVLERIEAEMKRAGKWKPTSAKRRPDKDADHQRTLRVLEWLKRPARSP